jgi:hypothetical protein
VVSPTSPAVAAARVHGRAIVDPTPQVEGDPQPVAEAQITLTDDTGKGETIETADDGTFAFEGLRAGPYQVAIALPGDWQEVTRGAVRTMVLQRGMDFPLEFRIAPVQGALDPTATDDPEAAAADAEQIIALASVSVLPIRFAEGRDVLAQLQRRVLGDGLIWLGVPFRTQIDGGTYQYVNCGPASLTMVLAGFGLEVGPSQVRDYLNSLIDNYDRDSGTSLDVLSTIGRQAGLTPLDLYSDRGGYRYWSTDAVRWHVQQGQPVITLVKYRNLPGHTQSPAESDHYIVISGLTPDGFIYNDAAFATTLGYGLEITDAELDLAWANSTIPHHAVAMGLAPGREALTFPEAQRPNRDPLPETPSRTARLARQQAANDEAKRPALILTPRPATTRTPPSGQSTLDIPEPTPVQDQGEPMGLLLEPTSQVADPEPLNGPGRVVPLVAALLILLGASWWGWLLSGMLVRATLARLPSLKR